MTSGEALDLEFQITNFGGYIAKKQEIRTDII